MTVEEIRKEDPVLILSRQVGDENNEELTKREEEVKKQKTI